MSRVERKRTALICDQCGNEIRDIQYVSLEAYTEDKGGWWHPDLHRDGCVFDWTMAMHKGKHMRISDVSGESV